MKEHNNVSLEPFLIMADQPQIFQPFFMGKKECFFSALMILVAFIWTLNKRSISFLYWGPQSWMQSSMCSFMKAELSWGESPLSTGWCFSFDAVQHMFGFLGVMNEKCEALIKI